MDGKSQVVYSGEDVSTTSESLDEVANASQQWNEEIVWKQVTSRIISGMKTTLRILGMPRRASDYSIAYRIVENWL